MAGVQRRVAEEPERVWIGAIQLPGRGKSVEKGREPALGLGRLRDAEEDLELRRVPQVWGGGGGGAGREGSGRASE